MVASCTAVWAICSKMLKWNMRVCLQYCLDWHRDIARGGARGPCPPIIYWVDFFYEKTGFFGTYGTGACCLNTSYWLVLNLWSKLIVLYFLMDHSVRSMYHIIRPNSQSGHPASLFDWHFSHVFLKHSDNGLNFDFLHHFHFTWICHFLGFVHNSVK